MHVPSGYMKSPNSVKSEDIDNMSQHSDDDDDVDCSMDRAHSPQLPLSLTTHERNRLSSTDTEPQSGGHLHSLHLQQQQQHQQQLKSQQTHQQQQPDQQQQNSIIKTELPPEPNSPHPFAQMCRMQFNGSDEHLHSRSAESSGAAVAIADHAGHQNQSNEDTTNDADSLMQRRSALALAGCGAAAAAGDDAAGGSGSSMKDSPQSDEEDLDMESDFRSPSSDAKRAAAAMSFPLVPNSMFSHSIMYMSHYIPQMGAGGGAVSGSGGGGVGGSVSGPGGSGVGPQSQHSSGSIPSLSPQSLNSGALSSLSNDERRKRNRTFIDPVTEVPKLEQWFAMNTHPSHNLIMKYTDELNRMPYRYVIFFDCRDSGIYVFSLPFDCYLQAKVPTAGE